MRGNHSHSSHHYNNSSSSSMPPHGQMYINMKTTVTTSGGQHNGLVVHSAIQSASTPSTSSNWMSPYIESPGPSNRRIEDRIEMLRSNSSLHRDVSGSSPLPIQMVPSTSRETLNSSSIPPQRRDTSPHVGFVVNRPPSPPASPIYSFKGRDSPPDEFIQPTKLVLNVFRPSHREPQWQVPISRNQVYESDGGGGGISLSKRNAVLNDAMTTTTTVEVFRAPLESDVPIIGLPPSPYGGQPLLVRTHGPQYEQWSNQRTQTMLSDEPQFGGGGTTGPKGVQWKERLVEGSVDRRYITDNSNGSDYAEIQNTDPEFHYLSQPTQTRIIHNDYRPNVNPMPLPSFQPVTHPIIPNSISSSREDLSRPYPNNPNTRSMSPLYIVPDRKYNQRGNVNSSPKTMLPSASPGYDDREYPDRDDEDGGEIREREHHRDRNRYQDRDRDRYQDRDRERHRNGDRYHHRRSKSTNRGEDDARPRSLRHRSMSPSHRSQHGGSQEFVLPAHSPYGSTLMLASPDPNELPGRPASARSQEIFALYQTRDAYNRVVDQL